MLWQDGERCGLRGGVVTLYHATGFSIVYDHVWMCTKSMIMFAIPQAETWARASGCNVSCRHLFRIEHKSITKRVAGRCIITTSMGVCHCQIAPFQIAHYRPHPITRHQDQPTHRHPYHPTLVYGGVKACSIRPLCRWLIFCQPSVS